MQVVTLCPLRVGTLAWQPRTGEHALTVACRATFELREGRARLAAAQEGVRADDRHYNDDRDLSVYAPADLVPMKSRVDVMMVGDACSPDGQPVRTLRARLAVTSLDKTVEVFGDRHFDAGGELVETGRFTRMSLGWERAAGGAGTANPVGVDRSAPPDRYGRRRVPNLQPPGTHVANPSDVIVPVGFGPIAMVWPSRRELLSRASIDWLNSRKYDDYALPGDFDPLFWQCAPADQRIDELRGDERILLENVRPGAPSLVCQLPSLRPRAFVERPAAVRELPLRIDTLWIDTSRGIFTLTWRGRVELSRAAESGRVLVAMDSADEPLTWAQIQHMAASRKGDDDATMDRRLVGSTGPIDVDATIRRGEDDTVGGAGARAAAALPFVAGQASQSTGPASTSPDTVRAPSKAMTTLPSKLSAEDRSPAWLARGSQPASTQPRPGGSGKRTQELVARDLTLDSAPPPGDGGASPWGQVPRSPVQREISALPPRGAPTRSVGSASPPPPIAMPSPVVPPQALPLVPSPAVIAPVVVPPPAVAIPPAPLAVPPPIAMRSPLATLPATDGAQVKPPNPIDQAALDPGRIQGKERSDKERTEAKKQPRDERATVVSDTVQLLWLDEKAVPKIKADPQWRELLADPPRAEKPSFGFDDEPPVTKPDGDEPRRTAMTVLSRGSAFGGSDMLSLLLEARRPDGSLEPPFALVKGTLRFPFDDIETLKAMVASATPFATGNKILADALDTANQVLAAPKPPSEMAANVAKNIRAAYEKSDRLEVSYLDESTEKTLLAERSYNRRSLLGDKWVRALLTPAAGKTAVVAYIPDAIAKDLPMFTSFVARLIVRVHPQQDQYEPSDVALEVVALGRVLSFGPR